MMPLKQRGIHGLSFKCDGSRGGLHQSPYLPHATSILLHPYQIPTFLSLDQGLDGI